MPASGRQRPRGRADDQAAGGVVARVVCLLRAVAQAEGSISIKQLGAEVGLAPSTVHRLLDHLASAEMVERAPHRRYRVSGEFSRIGALAARRAGVLRLAEPSLRQVSDMTGETALLGVLLPQTLRMIFVDKANAATPVQYPIGMHRTRSLLWGATGLCLLAWLGDEEIARVLNRRERSPVSSAPAPNQRVLAARLAEIRARGYAITFGEQTVGAVGIAAPVFGPDRRIVADLCMTVPQTRFARGDEARFAGLLTSRAAQLSRMLGFQPPAVRRTSVI